MKKMRKLASIILALVMALSMTMTAFAAEKTSKLTIKTTAGHTYSVYQLLIGDVSDLEGGSGILSNAKAGANLKADTTVDGFVEAIQGKTGAELGDTAYGYISGEAKYTVTGTGAEVEQEVVDGYYLVVDEYTKGDKPTDGSDTMSRYMVAVVGDTTMEPKTSTPSIDKKIIDTDANAAIDGENQKTDTAAIGDVIEYEVTGTVPNTEGYKYYYYVVHDTLSEGLTLNQDSFVVTIGNKTLTKGTEYYVYFDEDTNSFDLALEDLKKLVDTDNNGVSVGSAISIKYNATVNDKAAIGIDPNTNTAKLEYSNKILPDTDDGSNPNNPGEPGKDAIEDNAIVYTFKLNIIKKANSANGDALADVQFDLYKEVPAGTKGAISPDDAKAAGLDTSRAWIKVAADLTTDAKGEVSCSGLANGTYYLVETKTVEGYNLLKAPVEVTLKVAYTTTTRDEYYIDKKGVKTLVKHEVTTKEFKEDSKTSDGTHPETIINKKGFQLPTTGGMGTILFSVAGVLVMIAAAFILLKGRKKEA